MRRREKEITDKEQIQNIIGASQICRLGLSDGFMPYIVPLCFGYKDKTLFFHSAHEGKKREILKKNPNICFEFDQNVCLIQGDKPCSWGMEYQSVIGFGKVEIIENISEKREALEIIMKQYSSKKFEFQDAAINKTLVFKVKISEITGKETKKK